MYMHYSNPLFILGLEVIITCSISQIMVLDDKLVIEGRCRSTSRNIIHTVVLAIALSNNNLWHIDDCECTCEDNKYRRLICKHCFSLYREILRRKEYRKYLRKLLETKVGE